MASGDTACAVVEGTGCRSRRVAAQPCELADSTLAETGIVGRVEGGGCGCRADPFGAPALWLLVIGLAACRRS